LITKLRCPEEFVPGLTVAAFIFQRGYQLILSKDIVYFFLTNMTQKSLRLIGQYVILLKGKIGSPDLVG
jgi:hypothetical protein